MIFLWENVQPVLHHCVHKLFWEKDQIHCHFRGNSWWFLLFRIPESLVNTKSIYCTCQLIKNFSKRHEKNVEDRLYNLWSPFYSYTSKKNYFNLSLLYISKLCCKQEYVLLLYGDIQHNADNTQNVSPYWNGEKKRKKLVAYAIFCFLWREVRQYRQ